jgi:beta-galactosidase
MPNKMCIFVHMRLTRIILTGLTLFLSLTALGAERLHQNFDFDWKFSLSAPDGAAAPGYNDSRWAAVQLPHDWSMELPYLSPQEGGKPSMGFMQGGIGWYRKTFAVPAAWKGRRVSLEFDGVYHRATVYVNGREVGFHPYGYTAFAYDITDYLFPGAENVVAVKVDHSDCPTSRWYSGSGIYRHVWLNVTDPVHVALWGTSVTTPSVSAERAFVRVETTLQNDGTKTATVSLVSELRNPSGRTVARAVAQADLPADAPRTLEQSFVLDAPVLWDLDSPQLYTLVTTVRRGPLVVDRYETPFGIRDVRFDPDKGFFLNGRSVKMKGGDIHQDAGSLGAAMPDRVHERRIALMKETGFNAIRCSHNPPAREFLDACDRLGMLVIDEAFDKWKSGYYRQWFDEWWEADLAAMVLRDRNHPSVVLWSVGNETSEQGDLTGEGTKRLQALRAECERLDPSRKVAVTTMPDYDRKFDKNGFNSAVEVVGYNYQEPFYDSDHAQYPGRIIYGSEVFPYYSAGRERMREYIERNPWYDYAARDYVFGYFMWAAVDYWGESSGWPSKGWPTGIYDVCMHEKPQAAFFRAVWKDEPVVKIAVEDASAPLDRGKDMWTWPLLVSHWNFPRHDNTQMMTVHVMTNCETVELFSNGAPVAKRRTADFPNNTVIWRIPYNPGTLSVKGYNGGVEVASDELRTAGEPVGLRIRADRTDLAANGQDLSYLEIEMVDAQGVVVPDADRPVHIRVLGAGRFLCMDNGDTADGGSQLRADKPTLMGRAQVVVQAARSGGSLRVIASADGLPDAEILLIVR